jgi:hypothetical protein
MHSTSESEAKRLETFLEAVADGSEFGIHFARRRAENKLADARSRNLDVLVRAQDMYFRVCDDDARFGRVFNDVFGLAVFADDSADCAGQVVARQGLDVLDFERFDVQVVQSQQHERVLGNKAERECLYEIRGFLDSTDICGFLAGLYGEIYRCDTII